MVECGDSCGELASGGSRDRAFLFEAMIKLRVMYPKPKTSKTPMPRFEPPDRNSATARKTGTQTSRLWTQIGALSGLIDSE